jgi:hypothetical protein
MQSLGFECAEIDDPFAALAELMRRPLVYRAIVLSLTSLYREELAVVATIKRRLPHVDVWVTHIEGRQAALAEAMRLGADGLLAEDGLHRTGAAAAPAASSIPAVPERTMETENVGTAPSSDVAHDMDADPAVGEPVLTAEELRALLQEQPLSPPEEQA